MTAAANNRLSGAQKAAALVLAMGEDQAAGLLGRMHEDEVRELRGHAALTSGLTATE